MADDGLAILLFSGPVAISTSDRVARRLDGAFELTSVGAVDLNGKGPTRTWLLAGRPGPA